MTGEDEASDLRKRLAIALHEVAGLEEEQRRLTARIAELETAWDDKPLPEDAEIEAAHPVRTKQHARYAEAMRLVGARHSKGGLVALVNWLLSLAGEPR